MTFDGFWQRLLQKNQALANDETMMRMSVVQFRHRLRHAWDDGEKQGKAAAALLRKAGDAFANAGTKRSPVAGNFEDIVGHAFKKDLHE